MSTMYTLFINFLVPPSFPPLPSPLSPMCLPSHQPSPSCPSSSRPSPSHQPPTEAIEVLAALASPDGDREDVDETVVVYLMADILDRIETNVSMEFSMVWQQSCDLSHNPELTEWSHWFQLCLNIVFLVAPLLDL